MSQQASLFGKRLCRGTIALMAVLLIALSGLTAPRDAPAGGPTDPKEVEVFLDNFLGEQMEKLHVPGAVFVLVKDGAIFFAKGYGYADLGKNTPIVPDKTLFRAGSISKLFTATAVMQLAERSRLKLDDDVNKYLKTFRLQGGYHRPVTFANLLTHTSGLDAHVIGISARSASEVVPLGSYLATRLPPLVTPPGEIIRYTNHGYALAGYLVREISGESFDQYMNEEIFKPLDMHRSGFQQPPPPDLAPDLAVSYEYENGSYQQVPFEYVYMPPAGSLFTTATDIAHFMTAHLQGGRYRDARILRETTARQMHQIQFAYDPQLPGWCYGFIERSINGQRVLLHDGSVQGFGSRLVLLPDQNVGFFISYNTNYRQKLTEDMTQQFLRHYYGTPGIPAPPKPSSDFEHQARRFSGYYRGLFTYSQSTLIKLNTLFDQIHVSAGDDGTLVIENIGENLRRWVEVGPLLFRGVDGQDFLAAFREDRSRGVKRLFVGAVAYEKLSWYESTPFQLGLIGFFVLVFLSACILWPLGHAIRRLRKEVHQPMQGSRLAQSLAGIVSALNLAFILGFSAAFFRVYHWELIYGLPPAMIALLFVPLLTALLTLGLLVFSVFAWKSKYWSLVSRLHSCVATLASLAFVPFLLYWNLLGFRY